MYSLVLQHCFQFFNLFDLYWHLNKTWLFVAAVHHGSAQQHLENLAIWKAWMFWKVLYLPDFLVRLCSHTLDLVTSAMCTSNWYILLYPNKSLPTNCYVEINVAKLNLDHIFWKPLAMITFDKIVTNFWFYLKVWLFFIFYGYTAHDECWIHKPKIFG